jgi:hypothetical protein
MYYIDFPDGAAAAAADTYRTVLQGHLQQRATHRGWDVQVTSLGSTREGNRVYWFLRVNVVGGNAPITSPNQGRPILSTLLQNAAADGYPASGAVTTQPQVVQFDNAYRHLPPGGAIAFGNDAPILRGRFYGATGSEPFGFDLWIWD